MNENSASRWIAQQFREVPWTAWLVATNLVIWLLQFFQISEPASIVSGEIGVQTAWRWLTYPLYSPGQIFFFLIFLFVFYWIGGSLERAWGSEKFGRVFIVVTLLTAFSLWAGVAVTTQSLNPSFALAGLHHPETALFVIWAALNAEATILAFFVIPIRAKYMAAGIVVLKLFSMGSIQMGIAAVIVPIAGWFWAKKPSSAAPGTTSKTLTERVADRKRAKKKASFKVFQGKGLDAPESKAPDLRTVEREQRKKEASANAAELDRILDKIRFEGMEALSAEEKATLDRQSRRLKGE